MDKAALRARKRSYFTLDDPRTCLTCRFSVTADWGHSNYTVEGTEVDCLLGRHPCFPEDRWYGEEPALKFAGQCRRYEFEEDPTGMDCDRTLGAAENYSSDVKLKKLLRQWEAKQ